MHIKIQYNCYHQQMHMAISSVIPTNNLSCHHDRKMMSEHNLPADIVIAWSTNVFEFGPHQMTLYDNRMFHH